MIEILEQRRLLAAITNSMSSAPCRYCGAVYGPCLHRSKLSPENNIFRSPKQRKASSTDPYSAGNGSLMRLAPVPIAFANRPSDAIALAGESSRTTHGARECVDACRYFSGILVGLPKETVLSSGYTPKLWEAEPSAPKIAAIAAGSFKKRTPPGIKGTGYVIDCLEAALWAFHGTHSFRDAVLAAANLGNDADATAAVCGQLAGACYGTAGLPDEWLSKMAMRTEITSMATSLTEFWKR